MCVCAVTFNSLVALLSLVNWKHLEHVFINIVLSNIHTDKLRKETTTCVYVSYTHYYNIKCIIIVHV